MLCFFLVFEIEVRHMYFVDFLPLKAISELPMCSRYFSRQGLTFCQYWSLTPVGISTVWQYELWSFQTGGTKLERFLPKNQHTQRKLSNFENWVSGEVSKSAKSPNLLTFKVNFLIQNLSESFSIFFS